MSEKKSTGNLFVNDYKKTDKQPDYTGFLEITREQIQELVNIGKAGGEVKLKLGCWEYPSKRDANQIRLFIVAEAGEREQQSQSTGWEDQPF